MTDHCAVAQASISGKGARRFHPHPSHTTYFKMRTEIGALDSQGSISLGTQTASVRNSLGFQKRRLMYSLVYAD